MLREFPFQILIWREGDGKVIIYTHTQTHTFVVYYISFSKITMKISTLQHALLKCNLTTTLIKRRSLIPLCWIALALVIHLCQKTQQSNHFMVSETRLCQKSPCSFHHLLNLQILPLGTQMLCCEKSKQHGEAICRCPSWHFQLSPTFKLSQPKYQTCE